MLAVVLVDTSVGSTARDSVGKAVGAAVGVSVGAAAGDVVVDALVSAVIAAAVGEAARNAVGCGVTLVDASVGSMVVAAAIRSTAVVVDVAAVLELASAVVPWSAGVAD
jgi:hypothetical protein